MCEKIILKHHNNPNHRVECSFYNDNKWSKIENKGQEVPVCSPKGKLIIKIDKNDSLPKIPMRLKWEKGRNSNNDCLRIKVGEDEKK